MKNLDNLRKLWYYTKKAVTGTSNRQNVLKRAFGWCEKAAFVWRIHPRAEILNV